jgi:hypothetical protein
MSSTTAHIYSGSSAINPNLSVTVPSNSLGGYVTFPSNITASSNAADTNSSLTVKGNATIGGNLAVDGDLTVGGKNSLDERLVKIEERLCILSFNEQLEQRWAALRELRAKYMELEQDCLEKELIVRLLKGEKA